MNALSDQGCSFAQEGYQGRSPWLVRREGIFLEFGRQNAGFPVLYVNARQN